MTIEVTIAPKTSITVNALVGGLPRLIAIPTRFVFADVEERDAYFVTNPTELVTDIWVVVGNYICQWTGSWREMIAVIKGEQGDTGSAATVAIGAVTTVDPDLPAAVTNVGTEYDAIFDISIPRGVKGDPGDDGVSATVAIGSVTEGVPSVVNRGTDRDAVLDITLPAGIKGDDGAAATIAIGSVEQGSAASVTNSGTASAAVLDFVLQSGSDGLAATVAVGTVADGETASVTNSGTVSDAVLDFVLPRGIQGVSGDDGLAATVAVGTVATAAPTAPASVTNVGTVSEAVLDFEIPRGTDGADGADGAAATVAIGTVTTGAAGTQATATNSGTATAAVIDFTIPAGADGADGYTPIKGVDYFDGANGVDGLPGADGAPGADGLTTSVNLVQQVNGDVALTLDDIPDGTVRILGAGSGTSTLDGLTDVDAAGAVSGQALVFDGTSWRPVSSGTAGFGTLYKAENLYDLMVGTLTKSLIAAAYSPEFVSALYLKAERNGVTLTSTLSFTAPVDGDVLLWWRRGTETAYDRLSIWIDGVKSTGDLSGIVLAETLAFPVSVGNHTLEIRLVNDSSGSSDINGAYLYGIAIPGISTIQPEHIEINSLIDVDTSGAASGDMLVYDGAGWIPVASISESAYTNAVLYGYTGTEIQFYTDLASIEGLDAAITAIVGS